MTLTRHSRRLIRLGQAALGLLLAGSLAACGGGPSFPDWARVCGRHCAGAPVQIEAAGYQTCLRYAGGAMICWGDVRGSIDDVDPSVFDRISYDPLRTDDPRRATRLVPGMLDVRDMACGSSACCSLRSDDSVWCWGREYVNSFNTAKPGIDHPRADDRIPEPVPGLDHVTRLIPHPAGMYAVTSTAHEIGIGGGFLIDITIDDGRDGQPPPTALTRECELINGHVYCGGQNYFGQRGLGYVGYPPPGMEDGFYGPVIGIDDAVAIASGGVARCALRSTGEVWCWGASTTLTQQDPSYVPGAPDVPHPTPTKVEGLDHIVDLQGSFWYFCALRDDHQLLCWGKDEYARGILHTEGHSGERWQPYSVPDATDVASMNIRGIGICVIRTRGEVACNVRFPPEVTEPEGWEYGDLVTIPNLPDLPEDFPDEPTQVPEEPFDFDAAGPAGEPNFLTFP